MNDNRNKKNLHILFVGRSVENFVYFKTIFMGLLSNGHVVHTLFDKKWSINNASDHIEKFQKENKNFSFGWIEYRSGFFKKILIRTREILSYRRYLIDSSQSTYYKNRSKHYTPPLFQKLLKSKLFEKAVASKAAYYLLHAIELLAPTEKKIIKSIQKYNLDVILVSPGNLRFPEDIEYIKAAKKLNIPSVIQTLSWDNLTTKGIFHETPDRLLVWNKTQVQEAIKFQRIPPELIRITGAQQFDEWFSGLEPSKSKEAFCSEHNINPNSPLLVYLGSSFHMAGDETWLIKSLRKALDASSNEQLQNTHIIVRPHPSNAKIYKNIETEKVSVFPKEGSVSESPQARQLFYDMLYYSFATIGINTTAQLDSIIVDKPTMAYINEKYDKTQRDTLHFQQIYCRKALTGVSNSKEFLSFVGAILRGEDKNKQERKAIVENLVRPNGVGKTVGNIAAHEIEKLVT